ncbi:MAG: hypothetical protein IJX48_05620 [Paludibacteraceae bacterium]|nr:hypothetical protein [Paludibacteraceae bacterium]
MKKMNYFLVMLLVAIMPMVFTSCEQSQSSIDGSNNDKEHYEELIIGKWHVRESCSCAYIDGNEYESETDTLEEGEWVWEFDEFGTVLEYWSGYEEYDYQLKGDKLQTELAENFGANYFIIKSLTKNKMILETPQRYSEDGEYEYKYTITLKK